MPVIDLKCICQRLSNHVCFQTNSLSGYRFTNRLIYKVGIPSVVVTAVRDTP